MLRAAQNKTGVFFTHYERKNLRHQKGAHVNFHFTMISSRDFLIPLIEMPVFLYYSL